MEAERYDGAWYIVDDKGEPIEGTDATTEAAAWRKAAVIGWSRYNVLRAVSVVAGRCSEGRCNE